MNANTGSHAGLFMEDTYLVEIRLARTKWRIREMITGIAGAFCIGKYMERHPHVTLFGPLTLEEGTTKEMLLETIRKSAAGYGPVPFLINGWEKRRGMHGSVIAFSVIPSQDLVSLTRDLAEALCPITSSLNAWDSKPEAKWFHITVANRLGAAVADDCFLHLSESRDAGQRAAGRIFSFLRRMLGRPEPGAFPPLLLDGTGLRVTVMQNEEILAEYDLLDHRWIFGDHSHDSRAWQETLAKYRRSAGMELTAPRTPLPDDIFVIADLHLGHANIIRYCSRPFVYGDCAEMDETLIRNWNYTAGSGARIYHLGDLRYGKDAPPLASYLCRLLGNAVFVTGNHDEPQPGWKDSAEITYDGIRFFLVHDPADAPPGFDGWVIHGHHHNNELCEYPFINFPARMVNVSAEVAGYVPVSLREIAGYIRKYSGKPGEEKILLRYPYAGSGRSGGFPPL